MEASVTALLEIGVASRAVVAAGVFPVASGVLPVIRPLLVEAELAGVTAVFAAGRAVEAAGVLPVAVLLAAGRTVVAGVFEVELVLAGRAIVAGVLEVELVVAGRAVVAGVLESEFVVAEGREVVVVAGRAFDGILFVEAGRDMLCALW